MKDTWWKFFQLDLDLDEDPTCVKKMNVYQRPPKRRPCYDSIFSADGH